MFTSGHVEASHPKPYPKLPRWHLRPLTGRARKAASSCSSAAWITCTTSINFESKSLEINMISCCNQITSSNHSEMAWTTSLKYFKTTLNHLKSPVVSETSVHLEGWMRPQLGCHFRLGPRCSRCWACRGTWNESLNIIKASTIFIWGVSENVG